MSLWQQLVDAVWADTSLVRVEDDAPSDMKPERAGEEPHILTSPRSMFHLLVSLSLTYAGGSIFLFDLSIWWGVAIAFVGLVLFFGWCNKYPLRVLLNNRGDVVETMRLRDKFSKDQAAEVINARLGSDYRRLAFARVLRPNHELRHVLLLATPSALIVLPVGWESIGIKSYRLYRHDLISWFPLDRARMQVYNDRSFHRMHPRLRPRHHPNYLPEFFVLSLDDDERSFRLVLQFEVGTKAGSLLEAINQAQPADMVRARPKNGATGVLDSWHVPAPARTAQSG